MIHAWANTADRSHVVALTETHIVTSGNTDGRRGSEKLIASWKQTPTHRWKDVDHTIPIDQIYELRSKSTSARITVTTPDAVLTMRGFRWQQRRKAAESIANAAGLVQTATTPGVDHYARPGQLTERFDGDADLNTNRSPADPLTVRSLAWSLFSIPVFAMAGQRANDAATNQSLGASETVLMSSVAALCVIAGFRLFFMRLTFDDSGIVIVNFWRRYEIEWAELKAATTMGRRLRRPAVEFEWDRRRASTVTTCWTKARAQRIAKQLATQMDSRTTTPSAVYADELMPTGRPTSTSRPCLHAGSLFSTGRA